MTLRAKRHRHLCPVLLLLAFIGGARIAGATAFALVNTGELFVSDDQGATWSVRSSLPVSDAAALIAGATPQRLFLASRSGSIYRSLDSGKTWEAIGAVDASDIVDLSGRTAGGLLALTRSGTLWVSADGTSFTPLGALTASNHVSLSLGADGNLYALTRTGEVAQSLDDGTTWNVVGAIPVSDAASLRRKGASLFVLNETGLTYESTDYGLTWIPVGTVSQVGMRGLTLAGNQLLAVTKEGLTARSVDGTLWTWVGSVNQLEVMALANDVPQATGIPELPGPAPHIALAPLRPNPLRIGQVLTFVFSLPADDRIGIELFDLSGRLVARRDPMAFSAGDRVDLTWKPGFLATGVYFLRIHADSGFDAQRRVVIIP